MTIDRLDIQKHRLDKIANTLGNRKCWVTKKKPSRKRNEAPTNRRCRWTRKRRRRRRIVVYFSVVVVSAFFVH